MWFGTANLPTISFVFNVGAFTFVAYIPKSKNKYILLMFISATMWNMWNIFYYIGYLPMINPFCRIIAAIITFIFAYKSMDRNK